MNKRQVVIVKSMTTCAVLHRLLKPYRKGLQAMCCPVGVRVKLMKRDTEYACYFINFLVKTRNLANYGELSVNRNCAKRMCRLWH